MSGYYYKENRIKPDADPIDNVTKFAWDDEDYETVEIWHEYTETELMAQIQTEIDVLKRKLSDTDYVVIKIAEGEASREEYADLLEQRKKWRREINELERATHDS